MAIKFQNFGKMKTLKYLVKILLSLGVVRPDLEMAQIWLSHPKRKKASSNDFSFKKQLQLKN